MRIGHHHNHGEEHHHGHEHGVPHGHGVPSEHESAHRRETVRGHDHPHGHESPPGHRAGAGHGRRAAGWPRRVVAHLAHPHHHDSMGRVDAAAEASAEGLRAVWLSLAVLGLTAGLQLVVVLMSGSVALLGDTVHNVADALTAVPIAVAFVLGRRPPSRRFTYGLGRAEDLAGVAVVLVVAASAGLAAYEAVDRLVHPRTVSHLPAVALAGLIGFVGNEWVARHRITVGRRIGSAALVADGLHARTDGFTSLAVLAGAGGLALGWELADPVVGILISVAIAAVLRDAAREVFRRLMDAVDPSLVEAAERALASTGGVHGVGAVRLRWVGHELRGEADIAVSPDLGVVQAHAIAVDAEHALLHAVPRLTAATVHTDPAPSPDHDRPHAVLAHHAPA
ncbi:cation diffusion facilitator family transporter [Parafrankia sp. FMc2]|uniref:cation diffusion facilitator family transporter n=1 Tax=Parafrankia sp. FMc2 TaxID=3233196 RepID=UPI0034D5A74B